MTDIVERLKSDTLRSGTWADTGNLMLEAAEEIERLRAAIAAEREACAKIADDDANSSALSFIEQYRAGFIAAAIRNRSQP